MKSNIRSFQQRYGNSYGLMACWLGSIDGVITIVEEQIIKSEIMMGFTFRRWINPNKRLCSTVENEHHNFPCSH